jgi:hypothetical protein
MKALSKRICALEARQPGELRPLACYTLPGETFQQAAARLNLPPGGYLVCNEPATLELWLPEARAQQSALLAGSTP